jgi:hypothetical protein
MEFFDYLLVGLYAVFLIGMGVYLNRRQETAEDYYVGGRTVRWWASGTSTMATQLGTISFVSAPAFVALKDVKEGGGLGWLTYEFGVPLALIFIMMYLIPTYHRARVISIYEYLKKRFDSSTQVYVALLFQISRGLATGVAVYTIGFVVAIFFGEVDPSRVWPYVIAIGVITIVYDALGGIRAVIWSDVVQMVILLLGVFILTIEAYTEVGGFLPLLNVYTADPERFRILQFDWGYGSGQQYAFWPMLIGGFFLYISYYGCDQSQVQRELSVGSTDDVKRSLMLNAIGRFPVVFSYCLMGLFIGSFALLRPGFQGVDPCRPSRLDGAAVHCGVPAHRSCGIDVHCRSSSGDVEPGFGVEFHERLHHAGHLPALHPPQRRRTSLSGRVQDFYRVLGHLYGGLCLCGAVYQWHGHRSHQQSRQPALRTHLCRFLPGHLYPLGHATGSKGGRDGGHPAQSLSLAGGPAAFMVMVERNRDANGRAYRVCGVPDVAPRS